MFPLFDITIWRYNNSSFNELKQLDHNLYVYHPSILLNEKKQLLTVPGLDFKHNSWKMQVKYLEELLN